MVPFAAVASPTADVEADGGDGDVGVEAADADVVNWAGCAIGGSVVGDSVVGNSVVDNSVVGNSAVGNSVVGDSVADDLVMDGYVARSSTIGAGGAVFVAGVATAEVVYEVSCEAYGVNVVYVDRHYYQN